MAYTENKRVPGLDAEASPARTDYTVTSDTATDADLKRATWSQIVGLTLNADISDLSSWAGSSSLTTLGTVTTGTWTATAIGIAYGGTGVALSDPSADRILFWDNSVNQFAFLTAGSGLTITATTMTVDTVFATIDINGGTIDGVTIGGTAAGAVTATTLNATGGGALTGTWTDLGTVTTIDINGGTIDGVTIGGAVAGTGTFTTVTATSGVNISASQSYDIAGTAIISDSGGTATLSNIDALDSTTEATIESAIDTLGSLTSASSLVTVGTIGTGVWQGTTVGLTYGGTGIDSSSVTNGQILVGNTSGNVLALATITGTSNQVTVTNGASSITLSTPQNIDSGATPSFTGANLSGGPLNHGSPTELTIATGAITATQTYHTVDTESDAATDDLDTISGGTTGDVIFIQANHTDRTVVVKHGTGNIQTSNSSDISLDDTTKLVHLLYDGSNWVRPEQSPEIRYIQMFAFDAGTDCETGDGASYVHIPAAYSGMNLVEVHAETITAGTTGTMDIQIHNVTQTADMLSTKITLDSTESGSDTAATPAVIDTSNDDVTVNDMLRIDVDAVQTTAAKGLLVTMGFRLP